MAVVLVTFVTHFYLQTRLFFTSISFHFTYISQGGVATQLRYGGMFNSHVIENCPQNVALNNFKSVNIWRKCTQKFGGTFLMAHGVYHIYRYRNSEAMYYRDQVLQCLVEMVAALDMVASTIQSFLLRQQNRL